MSRLVLTWVDLILFDLMSKKDADGTPGRKPFAGTKLIREVSYLHPDESEALALRAERERCSKAEIIRRALREYLGVQP